MARLRPSEGFPPAISKRYKFVEELGQGAYGIVCSAVDQETKQHVAIKMIQRVIEKPIFAKRALREIKLLKHFNGHENITPLLEILVTDPLLYTEIYLVQGLMEADLHQIIRSKQPLSDEHYKYFIYQTCRGLKYIHSACVLHRDLKPGNLLVNADCELRICDFGLARGLTEDSNGFMTEYVATRWYRAPEIMLSFRNYTKAVDIWSVGCILAELLGGRPLFKGSDYVDQLNQILNVLGTPDEHTLSSVGTAKAQLYIRSLPKSVGKSWKSIYPDASEQALNCLEKLLKFDPLKRITVTEALEHPYLSVYHDPEDEPSHPEPFDFSFESLETIGEMKNAITREINSFKESLAKTNQTSPQGPLARPKDTLQGFTSKDVQKVSREHDENPTGAGDVDEELRIRESKQRE